MPSHPKRVTLREVATAAGVSLATASYALNGNPLVKEETRARVLAAAQHLNYTPDRNASRLLHGRTECIGVAFERAMAPAITGATFYATVVRGIIATLEEQGYALRLVQLDAGAALAPPLKSARRSLGPRDVDGLITLNYLDPVLMDRLRGLGVPLVALDASGAFPDVIAVDNDDQGSVVLGVGYLAELGHRRIAFLNETLAHPFGREALTGYMRACQDKGLVVDPGLLQTSEWGITGGFEAMVEVLRAPTRPTAVFAVSDEMAVGAMQAVQEAGLRVPRDISIMGMDDIPLASQVRPALTTVRVDMEALGRQAATVLLQAITAVSPPPARTTLAPHLVVRASTVPPCQASNSNQ